MSNDDTTDARIQALRSFLTISPDGCHLWTRGLNRDGYGIFDMKSGSRLVHRIMYEAPVGPIPPGHEAHHTCPNRHCANPEHVRIIVKKEHRPLHRSSHCGKGHAYTPENTRIRAGNGQICRQCARDYMRDLRRRKT